MIGFMATAPILQEPVRLIRRVEYEKLVEAGFFEDERVELLYGTIVYMTPVGPPHQDVVDVLSELLIRRLGDRARVRVQGPVAASNVSEPQPDIAVVARKRYRDAHPHETFLIIEVADSSLPTDRVTKARLYAETGMPEYWIVNVRDRHIEVYTKIVDGAYAQTEVYEPGARIRITAFPDVEIAVSDVL